MNLNFIGTIWVVVLRTDYREARWNLRNCCGGCCNSAVVSSTKVISSGGGGKGPDSGYILKVESTGIPDGLNLESEKK